MDRFDLVVVGSGQGGVPLARAFASAGRSVALVERGDVGGTCINTGCTPTKTMVASAEAAHRARSARELGVRVGAVEVDFAAVRERKRRIVAEFRAGVEASLRDRPNLSLIKGHARFVAPRELEVELRSGGTRRIAGAAVVLDVGGRPASPAIPGLDAVPRLDNVSLMELDAVPDHLVVLGAGYLGLEFGQMFRRFGSRVTLLEAGPRLLAREDDDVAEAVREVLAGEGVELRCGAKVEAVERGIEVRLAGEGPVRGSHLLVAVGRTPNTDDLGLEAAGIEPDARGFIPTDSALATRAERVYAIGDARGGPAFTHIAYDDFRILRDNLLSGGRRTIEGRLVPNVTYIDPQLGRVGLNETEAGRLGTPHEVLKLPMSHVARAVELNRDDGFVKVLAEPGGGRILGATVFGAEGGEIMSMLELAMLGGLSVRQLGEAIFAHPAFAELLNNLAG